MNEDLQRLAEFLSEPRTIRDVCKRFNISKPSAVTWLGNMMIEFSLKLETSRRRDGSRGPQSKTYKVIL